MFSTFRSWLGGISSICGQVVSYPLQLVRTRLQAQGMRGVYLEDHDIYTGIIDCVLKTVRRKGFFGLYKGIGANCLKTIPAISINYTGICSSILFMGSV